VTGPAAAVSVPATSANLGPGFDSLGLALELRDVIEGRFVDGSEVTVEVEGEGVGAVPTDATNLVARIVRTGLATFDPSGELGARGLALRCVNTVPHSRGLGSSAAAIVGGLALAAQLAGATGPDGVSSDQLVALASRLEGHPDNAAAAVLGGATIAWTHSSPLGPVGQAVRIEVSPRVRPVIAVPVVQASTAGARVALPSSVPHADASFNVARAALLTHALTQDPTLLLEATDDRLHQQQRRSVYPASLDLVEALRRRGFAAAISGAGPTVVVLGIDDAGEIARAMVDLAGPTWRVLAPRIAGHGAMGA
jgi:homoserine kinase